MLRQGVLGATLGFPVTLFIRMFFFFSRETSFFSLDSLCSNLLEARRSHDCCREGLVAGEKGKQDAFSGKLN